MATKTEKQLNALISSQQRIESMLAKQFGQTSSSGKDNPGDETNKLLKELISLTKINNKKQTTEEAKNWKKVGKGLKTVVQVAASVEKIKNPEKVVKTIGNLLSVVSFINPETGKPLATDKDIDRAHKATSIISKVAGGIAVFGLTMLSFGLVSNYIVDGMGTFVLVAGSIVLTLWAVDRVISPQGALSKGGGPLRSLTMLGVGIATFGLTMVAFSQIGNITFKGVGVFVLSLGLTTLSLYLMDKIINPNKETGDLTKSKGSPLKSMLALGLGIAIFGLEMWAFSKIESDIYKGALVISVSILGLSIAMLSMSFDGVKKGAINTLYSTASIAALGLTVLGWKLINPSWEDLSKIAAATVGLGLAMAGVGYLDKYVRPGSKSMLIAAGALTGITIGLAIFKSAGITWEDLGILGATIVGLGGAMAIAGILPVPVAIAYGSGAMIVAGLSLISISKGLSIFKKSGYTKEDGDVLSSVISELGTSFAKAGLKSPFILLGSAALYPASSVIKRISPSLEKIKKTKWDEDDSKMLGMAVSSVANAFLFDGKDGRADIGLRDGIRIFAGIKMLQKVGTALSGLASGIQSFAHLTFDEWEYDEKSGEMKVVNKVKLKPTDITKTGKSIGEVIKALVEPLDSFGRMMDGSTSGFLGLGKNGIERGIASFSPLAKGLSNLAEGVKSWARMEVVEYGVKKDPQTGVNELVPVKISKLKDTEITDAGDNIGEVIKALIEPLKAFGEAMDGSGGSFLGLTKNNIERAINSFTPLSTGIVNLAQGVKSWANMEVYGTKIINDPKTGIPMIVPDENKKMTLGDGIIEDAKDNIGLVLNNVVDAVIKWSSNYSKRDLKKTTKAMKMATGIGDFLVGMSEGVSAFASMEFIKQDVKIIDGVPTVAPKDVEKLDKTKLDEAKININKILDLGVEALSTFDKNIKRNFGDGEGIKNTTEIATSMTSGIAEIADIINNKFGKIDTNKESSFLNIVEVLQKMGSINNLGLFNKNIKQLNLNFTDLDNILNTRFVKNEGITNLNSVVDNFVKLSKIKDPFKDFVSTFDKFNISLDKFSDNFKVMGKDGVNAFNIWTESLIKAIEIGKDASGEIYNNFADVSSGVFDGAFQFAKSPIGGSDSGETTNEQRQRLIDNVTDNNKQAENKALLETINNLQNEITGLRNMLAGTLNVNVTDMDSTIVIRTEEV